MLRVWPEKEADNCIFLPSNDFRVKIYYYDLDLKINSLPFSL